MDESAAAQQDPEQQLHTAQLQLEQYEVIIGELELQLSEAGQVAKEHAASDLQEQLQLREQLQEAEKQLQQCIALRKSDQEVVDKKEAAVEQDQQAAAAKSEAAMTEVFEECQREVDHWIALEAAARQRADQATEAHQVIEPQVYGLEHQLNAVNKSLVEAETQLKEETFKVMALQQGNARHKLRTEDLEEALRSVSLLASPKQVREEETTEKKNPIDVGAYMIKFKAQLDQNTAAQLCQLELAQQELRTAEVRLEEARKRTSMQSATKFKVQLDESAAAQQEQQLRTAQIQLEQARKKLSPPRSSKPLSPRGAQSRGQELTQVAADTAAREALLRGVGAHHIYP